MMTVTVGSAGWGAGRRRARRRRRASASSNSGYPAYVQATAASEIQKMIAEIVAHRDHSRAQS